ncbi:TPA: DNA recombination protein RmuC, partial [Burkholderia multivorans]|nr:DNA recombination protein RmuC [Burkholderia multivorans]HDR9295813.1 DNA recombination protein RmuC [Burkholderia multivorans]HDR9301239.1 DNA recombination protein RmuC [Burkholderia multivorans]HDR9306782.1 DNA recombination protein RmuC [Burkholderia multivorans]HDR9312700.1 DNA recombination protein RmuC [Burkholderia multivorans]
MTIALLVAALVVLAVALAVAVVALVRGGGRHDDAAVLGDQIEDAAHAQARALERLERELRGEIVESARGARTELGGSFAQFQQTLAAQLTSVATVQNNQIEGFAQQLATLVAG